MMFILFATPSMGHSFFDGDHTACLSPGWDDLDPWDHDLGEYWGEMTRERPRDVDREYT